MKKSEDVLKVPVSFQPSNEVAEVVLTSQELEFLEHYAK